MDTDMSSLFSIKLVKFCCWFSTYDLLITVMFGCLVDLTVGILMPEKNYTYIK